SDSERSGPSSPYSLNYLQPYVTIALADLLIAHGSPDEAAEVLVDWLDLWRCARGDHDRGGCRFGPVPPARGLPEWFGIRAEFDLSVLVYRLTGEANITYHDFLKTAVKHFADFANPGRPIGRGVSIRGELEKCRNRVPVALLSEDSVRVVILRA